MSLDTLFKIVLRSTRDNNRFDFNILIGIDKYFALWSAKCLVSILASFHSLADIVKIFPEFGIIPDDDAFSFSDLL